MLWKPPFQADVTAALKPGANRLEVKVVNLWPNRIIGDQQPGADKKYTWLNANYKPFSTNSPLLESGLLGPVRLLSKQALFVRQGTGGFGETALRWGPYPPTQLGDAKAWQKNIK